VGELLVVRHGQTAWSLAGRHTSFTDVDLTDVGVEQALALRGSLVGRSPAHVFTSPRLRARRTAELAGFADAVVDERLAEWDYGAYEGLTSAEINEDRPGWTIWDDGGGEGGESTDAVTARLDALLADLPLAQGPVLCFAHGHVLRALTARWLGQPVADGRRYALDTGCWSQLDLEHEERVIRRWNSP
jgi:broad specificity phosphatase PhoE